MRVSQDSDKSPSALRPLGTTAGPLPSAYAQLHAAFSWAVPARFNIAQVCCTRWAALPNATKNIAVRAHSTGASGTFYTYFQLQEQANRLSHVLTKLGVLQGDRVAVVMPQCFETAVAYMAVLQMGAVAVPLSLLFGPDALQFRLQHSDAVLAIADAVALDSLQAARAHCPQLRTVIGVAAGAAPGVWAAERFAPYKEEPAKRAGDTEQSALPPRLLEDRCDLHWSEALAQASTRPFALVDTAAEDPAILIYTSGTTGNPKGALLPHRALIGNLPGFVASQNWFGFDGKSNSASDAVFWSPADWAWTGGLMDALLPTLYFGRLIVAYSGRFSPQTALELMGECGVTHTFLFPTALKAMMKAYPGSLARTVAQQFGLKLQAIMSAGEAVGDAVFAYCEQQLGVKPNEMFGQTEINYIVGNCNMQGSTAAAPGRPKQGTAPSGGSAVRAATSVGALGWPSKPGSMGMGYPGHRVQVIDEDGKECAVGVPGDVALHRYDVHGQPNPIFFLGYWKNEAATTAKYTGDWCRTGDLAVRDADGYLWYQGRSDDVFKSAGYRIGPGEIENCLVKHPAVLNAAVVPKPDAERGALVKAYVVIAPDFIAAFAQDTGAGALFYSQLTRELQAHVKGLLAPYEYPKEIEFVDALPMTTTGKVQRRVLRLQEEERAIARAAVQGGKQESRQEHQQGEPV